MLTLALPKSRLLDPVVAFFEERGVAIAHAVRQAGRALVVESDGMRLLLLKDADVPVYVEQGVADCGVAGLDQVLERQSDVLRLRRLPVGQCALMLITRPEGVAQRDGHPLVVATKYPTLVRELARRRGRQVSIVPLAGSVELAARLALTDAVVDLVETGRTLRENGLVPVEEWLRVAPYLIANRAALHLEGEMIRALWRTLGGAS